MPGGGVEFTRVGAGWRHETVRAADLPVEKTTLGRETRETPPGGETRSDGRSGDARRSGGGRDLSGRRRALAWALLASGIEIA